MFGEIFCTSVQVSDLRLIPTLIVNPLIERMWHRKYESTLPSNPNLSIQPIHKQCDKTQQLFFTPISTSYSCFFPNCF